MPDDPIEAVDLNPVASRLRKYAAFGSGLGGPIGVISAVFGGILSDVEIRRLKDALRYLDERVDVVELDHPYFRSEDWHDIATESFRGIPKEHYERKRMYRVEYLAHAMKRRLSYDEHVQIRVLQLLDELTTLEISVLFAVRDLLVGQDVPWAAVGTLSRAVSIRCGITTDQAEEAIGKLDREALTSIGGMKRAPIPDTGVLPLASSLNLSGRWFLEAIEPKADSGTDS